MLVKRSWPDTIPKAASLLSAVTGPEATLGHESRGGTKPADLSLEQLTKFDAAMNLTSAKSLGLFGVLRILSNGAGL